MTKEDMSEKAQQHRRDIAIISSAVSILAVACCGNEDKVINLLTGYLWDEEEAGDIKRHCGLVRS